MCPNTVCTLAFTYTSEKFVVSFMLLSQYCCCCWTHKLRSLSLKSVKLNSEWAHTSAAVLIMPLATFQFASQQCQQHLLHNICIQPN